MRPILAWSCAILLLGVARAQAQPLSKKDVPEPLKPWTSWVLWQNDERLCPFLQGSDNRYCAWPSSLRLSLDARGGRFTQRFRVHVKGWSPLPGDEKKWPRDVTVDGALAAVTALEGKPNVFLRPGEHSVSGSFAWSSIPESLAVPASTGLLSLTVGGRPVDFPMRDEGGTLWFQERKPVETQEIQPDSLVIAVYRKVSDAIPILLTTRIELTVAGKNREVLLGKALPAGFVPMTIESPLPARLETGDRLRVQIRPGTWTIEMVARGVAADTALTRPAAAGPWREGEEIWVFEPNETLRVVTIEGAKAIDTQQTTLPDDWKRLPAYAMAVGQTLKLSERRRGDYEPPDQLFLVRHLWLDFQGNGYSVSDQITGKLNQSWRLEMPEPNQLGRVSVGGRDQFITAQGASPARGVELRQGELQVAAESRIEGGISNVPAVGWAHKFDQASAVLHLPPGWRFFDAFGADEVSGAWIKRWSVGEIFLALLLCVAVGRFYGALPGLLALATFALTFPERGAPKWLWAAFVACEVLVRILPGERLQRIYKWYRFGALGLLAIVSVDFALPHLLHAIHPILERGPSDYPHLLSAREEESEESEGDAGRDARTDGPLSFLKNERPLATTLARYSAAKAGKHRREEPEEAKAPSPPPAPSAGQDQKLDTQQYDPKSIIQTGSGMPSWSWRAARLSWRGSVDGSQRIRLILLSPNVNRILAFLRVALIAALLLCFWRLRSRPGAGPLSLWERVRVKGIGGMTAAMLAVAIPAVASASEYPPQEILDQLKERLLAKPQCSPTCADVLRLRLELMPRALRGRLEVIAAAETAIALPGNAKEWLPQQVLIDGSPAKGLLRDSEGHLWVEVSPGRHQVSLEGALPARDTVQIDLKLNPHQVQANAQGWELKGIHEDGLADGSLQLTRMKRRRLRGKPEVLEMGPLPPFVEIKRTLKLGVKWEIDTQVERMTPAGSAVVLEVPLLPGESVTTTNVRVQKGKVFVTLSPQESNANWHSSLEETSPIRLVAPKDVAWTEIWRLEVGPNWHVGLSGIPFIHRYSDKGTISPQWYPWPGEAVTVDVSRPAGASGQTLTVDRTELDLRPSLRETDATLKLSLRSSRGGQHTLLLPEGAELQDIKLDGTQQKIQQEGQKVHLPLWPGVQNLEIHWRAKRGIVPFLSTPSVDIGAPSVNGQVDIHVPSDRWVLGMSGSGYGPTVLFWYTVALFAAVGIGLGRLRTTPLKTSGWLLLGLGLSQVSLVAAAAAAGWFLVLAWRKQRGSAVQSRLLFNFGQALLIAWALTTVGILAAVAQQGLMSTPEMEISGNASYTGLLRWFVDRSGPVLPRPWVVSLPMIAYRIATLAWMAWLAFSIRKWAYWAWDAFTSGGAWRWRPKESPISDPPVAPVGVRD